MSVKHPLEKYDLVSIGIIILRLQITEQIIKWYFIDLKYNNIVFR